VHYDEHTEDRLSKKLDYNEPAKTETAFFFPELEIS
jgi:hypothetical protein